MYRIVVDEQICALCGSQSSLISSTLNVCLHCIRERPEDALSITSRAHVRSRRLFDLPEKPPEAAEGIRCALCFRQCEIPEGERGFCGMKTVRSGHLVHFAGTPKRGLLHWYPDPLPTNCVADWVCSGHRQLGKHNLAVFYASCTLNCLFCQNWHFRETDPTRDRQGTIKAMSAQELVDAANPRTYCVCFFGGDPASQMPHALASGKKFAEQDLVVCWETAGTMHSRLLQRAVRLSLESGGCIKFDLKAFDDTLHRALTGCSNARTLENFELAASYIASRPTPPLVVASTLLVPGYVDAEEVGEIARFIANIDPNIPYALLGFHPSFMIHDLPRTSLSHAQSALDVARDAGLSNVRIGNRHLLSREY